MDLWVKFVVVSGNIHVDLPRQGSDDINIVPQPVLQPLVVRFGAKPKIRVDVELLAHEAEHVALWARASAENGAVCCASAAV